MPKYERGSSVITTMKRDLPHRIFFVRHGETQWNSTFRYQGLSDVELNEAGLEQARRAGVRLSGISPARAYSSPLRRALRTAEIIMENNAGGAAVEVCADLREISFGDWEGLTASEIMERDGERLAEWRKAPFSVSPPGGEPFSEVAARAARAARLIQDAGTPGDASFVVAHGAVLRALIASFLGLADVNALWKMRLDNCSISVIDMWGARPSVLLTNDTHHIRLDDCAIRGLDFPD